MQFKWIPNFVPNKIFLFGCGGTGSRVLPLIAQFVKSCAWVVDPEIFAIDFDIVETKNLTRQNFIAADVGKNKAAVLATRYAKGFNCNIVPITAKIDSNYHSTAEEAAYIRFKQGLLDNNNRNNIFILCVDSPEARVEIVRTILRAVGNNPENIIIDAGNENDFGQVTLSSTTTIYHSKEVPSYIEDLHEMIPEDMVLPFIPMNTEYFDNMKETNTPSCADLDQTMAINCLMAVNIFSIVQNIYYVKPISYFRTNISMQHGAIPQYMNKQFFSGICKPENSAVGKVRDACTQHDLSKRFIELLDRQYDFERTLIKPAIKKVEELKPVELKKKAALVTQGSPQISGIQYAPNMVIEIPPISFVSAVPPLNMVGMIV